MCLKFQKIETIFALICDRISIFHVTCVVYGEGNIRREEDECIYDDCFARLVKLI